MARRTLRFLFVLFLTAGILGTGIALAQDSPVELVMASWRVEDAEAWDTIINAFEEQYPNITVRFETTINTEYASVLQAAFEAGTAPDLIHCYPFDQFLSFYNKGFLADISDVPGMEHFSDTARSGWVSEDGSAVYCVPMASVIHGFYYNADMFEENGWAVPQTMDEFHALVQTIKDAGITPIAMGTKDGWTNYVLGLNTIGVNMWDGENGRLALVAGDAKLTDAPYLSAFEELASWKDYMPEGHESITYSDTTQLFLLGRAAMWPTGSWEIKNLQTNADFTVGLFKNPTVAGADGCWIYDFIDAAVGMNTATQHPDEARTFLEWVTTAQFAELFMNQQPGFFSLSDHEVSVDNELVQEFVSWRGECKSSLRLLDQYLSRGDPSVGTESFRVLPTMIQGGLTPTQAAEELQSYLWYPEK
ncbi:MAG: carbohydrate ABC transporter substrate-binding protein [Anaerolineae bacterium]|nr:carbohydrate ABC transporter substrate-binding protein [Anaerolineae bacterium]